MVNVSNAAKSNRRKQCYCKDRSKYISLSDGPKVYPFSKSTFERISLEAKARLVYGGHIIVDTSILDRYLENFRNTGESLVEAEGKRNIKKRTKASYQKALEIYPFGKHAFDNIIKEAEAKIYWQGRVAIDLKALDAYIDSLKVS